MGLFNVRRIVKNADDKFVNRISKSKENAFSRFPLLFTMLAAFGLVIMNNGIQGVIKKVEWLEVNPFITLTVGIILLLFTGTLYKKL